MQSVGMLTALMMCVMSIVPAETTAESMAAGLVNHGYAEKPDWFANSFLDIRLDLEFNGAGTTQKAFAKSLRVMFTPTLVFFDVQGKEVFRSEACLKSFHVQTAMDYLASGSYLEQPGFQRFI